MIFHILENTKEFRMTNYELVKKFLLRGVTLDKNPSDQTVRYVILDDRDLPSMKFMIEPHMEYHLLT